MEKDTVPIEIDQVITLSAEDVMAYLNTGHQGLSSEEASKRQAQFGKNEIEEKESTPTWKRFLSHFTSTMAILLWVGGLVAIFAGEAVLGIAIFMVNIINGIFSFWQEGKALDAADALKNMIPSYTTVIRDGQEQEILSQDVVPGDLILLSEGDAITADGRLIESANLQVEQSTLTGEVNPIRKVDHPVFEENLTHFETPNLVFTGTGVSEGTGKLIACGIGMDTEFGKIAGLTQNMEAEASPLEIQMDRLTRQVSIIAAFIAVLFFFLSVFVVGDSWTSAFIFALGMFVAFIPEGLLPTLTLSLAQASQRMSSKNALVKDLNSVETLGSTTVICTDKTGTLSQNEMTVNQVWTADHEFAVTGVGYKSEGEIQADGKNWRADENLALQLSLTAATLCSNAKLIPPENAEERFTVLGDPTEACLEVVARKGQIDVEALKARHPRLRELPFESRRKRMTTINQVPLALEGSQRIAFTKGAPKEVMELSNRIVKDGQIQTMTDGMRQEIIQANDNYAKQGLRVLGVAYRPLLADDSRIPKSMSDYTPENIEEDMTFLGLIVMQDPPRPEVKDAVRRAHEAGIRIIMITGDYGLTAESIARKIGIIEGNEARVVSGPELDEIDDQVLKEWLQGDIIFARVAPEQKLRIVENLQELDEVVAMTGDGVNDAPALKKANIGVAMGIAGTDVAKESADMILTDDNFATIIDAVEEGRAVYDNIRKFLTYILTSNVAEAVPSLFYLLSGGAIPLPLVTMQILTIDLGTDLIPALGLGGEKPEPGIMTRPPRQQDEAILNKQVFFKSYFWYGLIEAFFAMAGYFMVNHLNGWPEKPLAQTGTSAYVMATTMTLASIIFGQMGNVQNCRTNYESVFKIKLFSNKLINIGIVSMLVLLVILSYTPGIQQVFHTGPLPWQAWLILIFIPILTILIEEIRKAIVRHRHPLSH